MLGNEYGRTFSLEDSPIFFREGAIITIYGTKVKGGVELFNRICQVPQTAEERASQHL